MRKEREKEREGEREGKREGGARISDSYRGIDVGAHF